MILMFYLRVLSLFQAYTVMGTQESPKGKVSDILAFLKSINKCFKTFATYVFHIKHIPARSNHVFTFPGILQ